MLQNPTIKFLKDLKKNNNREWFDANRPVYDKAKADFDGFVEKLITALIKTDPRLAGLQVKDCIFRIYRDVRFSKNKDPYKTNFAASVNIGGKKSPNGGFYIHIEPEGGWGSFIGGGYWMPEAPTLKKLRQEVEFNHEEFFKILKDKNFKKHFKELEVHKLSRVPKGMDPEHPAAEYLKYTSFLVTEELSTSDIKSPDLIKKCVAAYKAMLPFLDFLNRVHH
jgi:uncharacterized protein (TIGR02453 family)